MFRPESAHERTTVSGQRSSSWKRVKTTVEAGCEREPVPIRTRRAVTEAERSRSHGADQHFLVLASAFVSRSRIIPKSPSVRQCASRLVRSILQRCCSYNEAQTVDPTEAAPCMAHLLVPPSRARLSR